ncbi:MAG TPA: AMP-binding protein [Burkholderiaceae bacterium]|nr:AMP-binding protein [Burkholderiaceae bacterium]
MTLVELLERQRNAAVPVLYDRDRSVSFAALADESAAVAAGLAAAGVAAGDRVAIWLPNVPAWLAAFFACARLGAIAVAVNTRFRSHELADILARSGARALLYWPGFDKADFVGVLAGCPAESLRALAAVVEYAEDDQGTAARDGRAAAAHETSAAGARGDRIVAPRDGGRVAWPAGCRRLDYAALAASTPMTADHSRPAAGCAMFTTSGTTRAPKFVLHDQQTLTGHAREVVRGFDIDGHSTMLLAPPLCGVFGVCCVLAMIAAGRPSAMTPVWDAAAAARTIDRLGITHLNGTDDAIAQLLAQNTRTPAFPTLRFAGYAAFNPALDDIVERADARGLAVVGLYGASEVQALFARQATAAPVADRRLAGGRPVGDGARVRACDPATQAVLPHGEAGELQIFAPVSRMVGYFQDEAATRAAITDDGWYRSGDLGHTMADGRFVYLTRLGDSLRLGGFLTSPAEIESVVQQVPGVRGCQVIGITLQQALRPVAFVTLADAAAGAPIDEAALERRVIDCVAGRLARYKVPARVFVIDVFPVTEGTNATKIQKHRLRDLALRRLG